MKENDSTRQDEPNFFPNVVEQSISDWKMCYCQPDVVLIVLPVVVLAVVPVVVLKGVDVTVLPDVVLCVVPVVAVVDVVLAVVWVVGVVVIPVSIIIQNELKMSLFKEKEKKHRN